MFVDKITRNYWISYLGITSTNYYYPNCSKNLRRKYKSIYRSSTSLISAIMFRIFKFIIYPIFSNRHFTLCE